MTSQQRGKLRITIKLDGGDKQVIEIELLPDEIAMPHTELVERVIRPAVEALLSAALPEKAKS